MMSLLVTKSLEGIECVKTGELTHSLIQPRSPPQTTKRPLKGLNALRESV